MLHIIINHQRYDLDSNEAVRFTQNAMKAAGIDEAPVYDAADDGSGEVTETGDTLPDEYKPQVWAFAKALDCSVLSNIGYDGRGSGPDVWTSDDEPGEYLVLTDSERDDAIGAYLDGILEESVMREIPDQFHDYFNRDAWKEDQINEISAGEGYGGPLASYDGHEREACVEGEYFYIYRVG
jgi:hypothetical protein